MADGSSGEEIAAGAFLPWLDEIDAAVRGERDADVACGTCTACCTASQFVHIAPDETDALAHIPKALLFRAPRLHRGHVLMGYDARGRCPMLGAGGCTIYDHRPRTCRTYDCRVFPAAGIEPDDEGKAMIAERARRWRFDYPGGAGHREHAAVRAAAGFLAEHPEVLPDGVGEANATQLAVLALSARRAFGDGAPPALEAVRVALRDPRPRGDVRDVRSGCAPTSPPR